MKPKHSQYRRYVKLVMLAIAFVISLHSLADAEDHSTADDNSKYNIVIQVSSADKKLQQMALNNVINVKKHFGTDNVDIKVVAYGPGLSLLTKNSPAALRVKSMAMSDGISFNACGNTMRKMKQKTGKMPVLTEGVKIVPSGVARIVELDRKGYSYVRP